MKNFFSALLKAACYTLLFFLMQIAVGVVAYFIFAIQQGMELALNGGSLDAYALMELGTEFLLENTAVISIVSAALSLLVLLPVFSIGKKKYRAETSLVPARPARSVFGALLFGLSFAVVVSIGLDLLPISESAWEEYAQYSELLMNPKSPLLAFLATVIVAPITEEIFFRGLIYTRLKRGMPMAIALLLEAALFGAMHGTPIQMAYAFVLGVLLTLLYEKFGSVYVSIAFHMAFNLVGGYFVMMIGENEIVYWAALAISAAISIGAAAWLVSMPSAPKPAPAPVAAPAAKFAGYAPFTGFPMREADPAYAPVNLPEDVHGVAEEATAQTGGGEEGKEEDAR